MDNVLYGYLISWMALYGQWKTMLIEGAEPSKLTDGIRLNGLRNQMKWVIIRLQEDGYTFEKMIKEASANGFAISGMEELPPEMPADYMKDRELVCRNAKMALECYHASPEYVYIQQNISYLSENMDMKILRRIRSEMSFVQRMELALEHKRYGEMKLYADTEKYMPHLKYAAELLKMHMNRYNPFLKKSMKETD